MIPSQSKWNTKKEKGLMAMPKADRVRGKSVFAGSTMRSTAGSADLRLHSDPSLDFRSFFE